MTVEHRLRILVPLALVLAPACDKGTIPLDAPEEGSGSGSDGDDQGGGTGNVSGSEGSSGGDTGNPYPSCGMGDGTSPDDAPADVAFAFTIRNSTDQAVLIPPVFNNCAPLVPYVAIESWSDDAEPSDSLVDGSSYSDCFSHGPSCDDLETPAQGCNYDECAYASPLLLQPGAEYALSWDRLWLLQWTRSNICEGEDSTTFGCTHRGLFSGDSQASAEVHAVPAALEYCNGAPCACPDDATACVLDGVAGDALFYQEDLTWANVTFSAATDSLVIDLTQ